MINRIFLCKLKNSNLTLWVFLLSALVYPASCQKIQQDTDNGGLTLPEGFKVVTVVRELGRARHMAVGENGNIFVRLTQLKDGKGIFVLQDIDGDGKAEGINGLENSTGTGITIYKNFLYASTDSSVFRFPLNNGIPQEGAKEMIVSGLPYNPQHAAKSITIDENGKLYVNIGAPSNSCQQDDRTPGSMGMDPCPLLDSYAGIWQFDAERTGQTFSDGIRFATGLRNCVALEWDSSSNQLYAVPHGRDQLNTLFPSLYNDKQNAELPSEEFFLIKQNGNYGWPYCYYDHIQSKKILAPEYGGNGETQTRCETMEKPLIGFPGHWAPNDLLFYHGSMFPKKYKNGAFIAFHGSWNRAPLKQGGYFVAFVPFVNGQPTGTWEVFAENFAGGPEIKSPGAAKHRPMGLAEGPDGSLYIVDSVKGRVWRIMYEGK